MDYVIRGGTIVDGTGGAPVHGDLHLRDGVIVAAGDVPDAGDAEVVDATGKVVSPGFIDAHTHFDAQILWDPDLTPSAWHGVTTVFQGNCGFGLAPTRPADRENIMETLKNVEGMNVETLRAGIRWEFETFPEYLALIDSVPKRINVGTFIGHTPLRTYVMGPDAATSRAATEEEIASMAEILAEGIAAGAVGFSTSQAPSHMGAGGRPVPSRLAADAEITELLGVVSRSANPLVEITYGHLYDLEQVAGLSRDLDVRITWGSLLTGLHGGPGASLDLLERASKVGGDLWPQVSCRKVIQQMSFEKPYYFSQVPAFREIFALGAEDRTARYRDPAWRDAARAHILEHRPNTYTKGSVQETERHRDLVGIPLIDLAAERGVHPFDLMLDLALEEDLGTRFEIISLNDDEVELGALLADPRIVLGAHDAGAHVDMLCDACYPSYLLGYWVRETGTLTLEEAVWRLTGQTADLFRLRDRGRLAPGLVADVVVFDPATVAPAELERRWDFPAHGDRLIVDSIGIEHVWVNGTLIRRDGADLADMAPGTLVR